MNTNVLITPPSAEPVTLAEFKAHAKIDDANDDSLCTALLRGARQWCEHFTRRAFIAQTWMLSVGQMPALPSVALPRAPLIAVTNVTVYDAKDNPLLWGADNYYVESKREPARLILRNGANWPDFERVADAMTIEYVAGYGTDASNVPEPIKLAIKQLALHWYEYRGEAIEGSGVAKAPLTVEALLEPYRLLSVRGS